jgi:hypothetical protein
LAHFARARASRYIRGTRSFREVPKDARFFALPMRPTRARFLGALVLAATAGAMAATALAACSDTTATAPAPLEDAAIRRDVGPVEPPMSDAGAEAGGSLGPSPSCASYCDAVMGNCTGSLAQYASYDECTAFCAALPPGSPGDDEAPTVACRQYYAGSPAKIDPMTYCPSAGPWGGGVCGDRCTAFCRGLLTFCSPDAGPAPYASYPDCATACAALPYTGDGDGGGAGLDGPETGDTLNCRLFHLRGAVANPAACDDLAPDGGPCK